MSNTQLLQQAVNGFVYSDPLDPDFTVRFKTTTAPKSLNGKRTTNYVTEIIVNDNEEVTLGGSQEIDRLSVRIKVSASLEAMDRVQAVVASIASQMATWNSENVLLGFQPTTVPVNP